MDTGATLSIISEETYKRLYNEDNAPTLKSSGARLRTYTGEAIKVIGELEVSVRLDEQQECLNLLVVEGKGPSLLGRDWLNKFRLNWSQLNQMRVANELNEVLENYTSLFQDELGCVDCIQAKIVVDPDVSPKFCRPRTVPFALRGKIDKELEIGKPRRHRSSSIH